MSHTSKNEFIRSFFGRILVQKKTLRDLLTFRNQVYGVCCMQLCQNTPQTGFNQFDKAGANSLLIKTYTVAIIQLGKLGLQATLIPNVYTVQ